MSETTRNRTDVGDQLVLCKLSCDALLLQLQDHQKQTTTTTTTTTTATTDAAATTTITTTFNLSSPPS